MLLSGKPETLEPRDWSYRADPARTAIAILPEEGRSWIKWNLKDIKALSWGELDNLLEHGQWAKRIGRLREIYATEIQQRLLTYLGRVGQPANLPVPFPADVSLFYVDRGSKTRKLDIESIDAAACYVGKGADSKPVHRLVLTEQACDHIEQALQSLNDNNVLASAKPNLMVVKTDRNFLMKFERGEIEVPPDTGQKPIRGLDNKVYAVVT